MYDALKAAGGHVRLWLYQGMKHDSWTRAYNEPELPRWLLSHRALPVLATAPGAASAPPSTPPGTEFAERLVIPFHPPAIKLTPAQLDALAGSYDDRSGRPNLTLFRQGDALYEKNLQGEIAELGAESPTVFFYVNGSATTRLTFERDPQGQITLLLRDDRHEEHWEKQPAPPVR
jgi:hypothetical protein